MEPRNLWQQSLILLGAHRADTPNSRHQHSALYSRQFCYSIKLKRRNNIYFGILNLLTIMIIKKYDGNDESNYALNTQF